MSKQSALNDEEIQFCFGVKRFIDEYTSLGKFADMVDCREARLSKTTAGRLVHGRIVRASLAKLRPHILKAFNDHLSKLGFTSDAAEAEITRILNNEETPDMLASRCILSPEAVRHFGLRRDPFDVDHLPYGDEVFTDKELDAVAARVRDAVMYQRFVAVVGGVGTGKTLLKNRIAGELQEEGKSILIYPEFFDMEQITVGSIASQILVALDQKVPNDKSRRVNRIKEVLIQLQQENIAVAIVMDEIHRAHDRVISSFKNFWEMTNGRNARLLGVLLFGQPSFVEARLRDSKFKEIRERVQVIRMPELNGSSYNYVAHRLKTVGGKVENLFEPDAIKRISLNAVTPLALGNFCNEALMEAFSLQEKKVTASMPFFKRLGTGQQVIGLRRSAA